MKFVEWKHLIRSSESADRAEAADTLPEDGDGREIAQLLLDCVDDDVSLVRACALDTLHLVSNGVVAAKVRQCLEQEQDPLARTYAARTLALIGRAEDLPLLLNIMNNDRYAVVRTGVAQGIISNFLAATIGAIVAGCDDKDEKTRMASFAALTRVSEEMLEALTAIRRVAVNHQGADEPRLTQEDIAKLLRIVPEFGS